MANKIKHFVNNIFIYSRYFALALSLALPAATRNGCPFLIAPFIQVNQYFGLTDQWFCERRGHRALIHEACIHLQGACTYSSSRSKLGAVEIRKLIQICYACCYILFRFIASSSIFSIVNSTSFLHNYLYLFILFY